MSSNFTIAATSPYTPTVMTRPMTISTTAWFTSGSPATVPSAMAMISADRMKSVRMAPLIFRFSSSTRSTFGSASACSSSARWAASSSRFEWVSLCATFSNPS